MSESHRDPFIALLAELGIDTAKATKVDINLVAGKPTQVVVSHVVCDMPHGMPRIAIAAYEVRRK